MNYGALELDIVDKLAGLTADFGVEVVACPETEAQFKTPTVNPRVTVSYSLSDFMGNKNGNKAQSNAFDGSIQEEHVEINIELQARTLRGDGGIYNLIEATKKLLLGYMPLNETMDPIKLRTIKLEDFSSAIWTYLMVISTGGKVVSVYADDDGPALEDLSFDENF